MEQISILNTRWKYASFKNPERFLPGQWPTYFKSSKGCKIRDLDGNLYYDFSLMGIGTNILGYSNSFVDNGIKKL